MPHDGSVLRLVLIGWSIAAALQLLLWLIQQRTRNAGIVDVGWAGSFSLLALWFASQAQTPLRTFAPMAAIVLAWSVRLTIYLIARGAASGPEEGRYADLRQRWAPNAARSFFVFFQAQAALSAFLSLSLVAPFLSAPHLGFGFEVLRWLGTGVAAIGIAGEAVADLQLARFRRQHAGQGRVCDVGLWRTSRHPNYFFEWLVWVGHALHCLAFPFGWIALSGQALIFASIWKVTGIPATEAQALRTRGDAYRAYQKRVSAFFPLPPKRH
jgi:steroid 5-alpha reductase family enzyme